MTKRVDVVSVRGKAENKRRASLICSVHVDTYEFVLYGSNLVDQYNAHISIVYEIILFMAPRIKMTAN